jgi:hypothetical protein
LCFFVPFFFFFFGGCETCLHTLREEHCAEEGLAPEERESGVIGGW